MTTQTLPAGTISRLHILPADTAFNFTVMAASKAECATPEAMLQKGELSTMLTHDAGIAQPDSRGWLLARAVIERGGAAMFGFETLADAMSFKRLLDGAAA